MLKLPPLAIFGTSSFAKKIAEIGVLLGYVSFVFLRPANQKTPTTIGEWPVKSDTEAEALFGDGYVFALGVGDGAIRKKIADRNNGLPFINIIHPLASFGADRDSVLSKTRGLVVEAGARLCSDIEVGDFCIVNLNATIGHDCVLGNFVTVSPGANVLGSVLLDDGVSVGAGSVIMLGRNRRLKIGAWAKIGPTAWITNDVGADETMICQPARKFDISAN